LLEFLSVFTDKQMGIKKGMVIMSLQAGPVHQTLLGTQPLNSLIQIIHANYEANQQPINMLICKREKELKRKRVSKTEKSANGVLQGRTYNRTLSSKKERTPNEHVDILV